MSMSASRQINLPISFLLVFIFSLKADSVLILFELIKICPIPCVLVTEIQDPEIFFGVADVWDSPCDDLPRKEVPDLKD